MPYLILFFTLLFHRLKIVDFLASQNARKKSHFDRLDFCVLQKKSDRKAVAKSS